MQTVQTQIRLLLKEQSDQGLHCLPFHLAFKEQLHEKHNLGQNKCGMFEILGHLPYMCIRYICTVSRSSLTFITLWANSADGKLMVFVLFYQKIGFDILCKGDNLHEMSNPIFWENKKNISKC